nr:hypothetical protein [Hutsoniella sourekii]
MEEKQKVPVTEPIVINTGLYTGNKLIVKGLYGYPDIEIERTYGQQIIVIPQTGFDIGQEQYQSLANAYLKNPDVVQSIVELLQAKLS